jgi:hypothetical protein
MVVAAVLFASGCATGIVNKQPTYITDVSATVNGLVWTTDGGEVSYWVEYGTTTAYGQETTHQTVDVAEDTPHDVSVPLADLSPAATIHYRLCAEDAQAGTCSKDATLSTGDSVVGEARQCAGGVEPPCQDIGVGPIRDVLTADAHSTASGNDPSGTIEIGLSRGSRGATYYTGAVTCLHVADDVAIVGALGQHSGGAFEADNYPVAFVVRVTDGGGPGSRDDTWEFLYSEGQYEAPPPPAPTDCPSYAADPPDPYPFPGVNQEGDVVVTDAVADN